jgi:RND family efflux transporter MFP subunit
LLAACSGTAQLPARVPTAVKVTQMKPQAAGGGSRYAATINAASRVELAFRMGGYVEQIGQVKGVDGKLREVQEGDRVPKGMQLARVRLQDYEQKLSEANAALSEASASRAQTERDYERASRLFGSGSISRAEMDVSKARMQSSRARVQGSAARVAEAQSAMGDASLVSPFEGVILKRNLETGALVAPGLPCFSIADTTKVKVLFGVADSELEKLKVGSVQNVSTEAFRGRVFKGQISRIAPAADAKSHVFEVEVTIPNPGDELKVGMTAALSLPTAPGEGPAPLVPLTAVVRSATNAEGFAVYVVKDQVAHLRDVELGGFVGNSIPVKSGLTEGESVVTMGATLLSDGQTVQIIP